jgi:UDP-N-acetylglucosamine 2-epimerase (non-hydrolysing)
MHRRENIEIIDEWFSTIEKIACKFNNLEFLLPMHPNPNILKYKNIFKKVNVVDSMNHKDLLAYLADCKVVITDSGGIQEESSFLKKRCIVCRKETERVEGMSIEGHAVLCKSPDLLDTIFKHQVENYEINKDYDCPYGEGNSAKKFVKIYKNLS